MRSVVVRLKTGASHYGEEYSVAKQREFFAIGSQEGDSKSIKQKQEALLGIVGGAMLLGTAPALAQEQASEELDEVVVTGLRGSMLASMNIKREAAGVVDAISAEDIGKFPTRISQSPCSAFPAYPSTALPAKVRASRRADSVPASTCSR